MTPPTCLNQIGVVATAASVPEVTGLLVAHPPALHEVTVMEHAVGLVLFATDTEIGTSEVPCAVTPQPVPILYG